MSSPWFDPSTGELLLDKYAVDHPAFKAILADGVVTDDELAEQGRLVIERLQALESRLPADLRDQLTEVLTELAVLHAVQVSHAQQCSGRVGRF